MKTALSSLLKRDVLSLPCVMLSCDLEFFKVIAKGRYSRIHEVRRVDSGEVAGTQALKLFTKFDPLSIKHILREEYILRRIATATKRSPFIITYFESMELRDHPAFLLSKGCGMDLFDLALKSGRMTEEQAKFYACELVCGLEHLHLLNIEHCDIKPENVLLYHTGHIMIADFDVAMDHSVSDDPNFRNYAGGTPGYEAPEILKRITCTSKSDIWSMAAVVADLVSPRRLGMTKEQLKNTKPGEWDRRFLTDLSIPFQVFFTLCFEENYRLRPSIWEVKRLKFFKDVNWQNVENLKLTPPYNFMRRFHLSGCHK
nr:rac beta serine:threonine protein kinase [Hymenolepis microstoma]